VRRSAWVAGGVAVVGSAVTAVRVAHPALLAVRSPTSSPVIESLVAMAALLLACLAFGRWRQHGLLADLWVCYGISVVAAGKLAFVIVPVLAGSDIETPTLHAAALIAGSAGALFILLSTCVSFRKEATPKRPMLDLVALLGVVFIVSLGIGMLGSVIGTALQGLPDFVSTDSTGNLGNVGITVMQSVTAAMFLATALLICVRRPPPDDRFYGWLAVACVLLALSRVNYAITPHRLAATVTVGDWLRLAAYALLVLGAVRELRAYWQRLADAVVMEERRRMARELHDGLAQELAFIAAQSTLLVRQHPASQRPKLLRGASERALDESRRAIAALSRPTDEPLAVTLAEVAEEVGGRLGARVHLELADHIRLRRESREELVRITREAVTNAVRHGRAGTVTVRLANHDGVLLEITDNGEGFDPDDLDHLSGRLGLQSMEERATRIGGRLELASRPRHGTVVRVRLP